MMNERAQQLLRLLVNRYIREGSPVGSKALAADLKEGISTATIRSVMSQLESMGYVHAPHTSAGRVPTALGYRFFVDSLLDRQAINPQQREYLKAVLNAPSSNLSTLAQNASNAIAELTQTVGIVTVAKQDQARLKHVELLPLSDKRILVVMVLQGDEVQNRIIEVERHYHKDELTQISNMLAEWVIGQDLVTARKQLLAKMDAARQAMDQSMQEWLKLADNAMQPVQKEADNCIVAGQNHLIDLAHETSLSQIKALFEAFNQKHQMLHLLDRCLIADGVQIYIGEEVGSRIFADCSVIAAPYSINQRHVGVIGVIGPTRMSYNQIIPMVDLTARMLTSTLNHTE